MTLFLVINFSLGLVGFFLLQIFQVSLTQQTAEKAQMILGADISVNARRLLPESDRLKWEEPMSSLQSSHVIQLFSMVRHAADSRLTQLLVIDDAFPLYGQFKLSRQKFQADEPRVWLDPEVQQALNLKDDEVLQIGDVSFKYSGTIIEDPTRLFRGTGFAPRAIIHQKYLAAANLVQPGSTLTDIWNYKLQSGLSRDEIKKKIEKVITDPTIQIETAEGSAQDSNQVLKYFTDYLGLVALVSLGLCFLSGYYLLQWNFQVKKKNCAILKTLGLSDRSILFIFLLESLIICLISGVLSLLIVSLSLPSLQHLIQVQLNWPLQLQMTATSLVVLMLLSVVGPLLMSIPQFLQIIELNPLELLQAVTYSRSRSYWMLFWVWSSFGLFWLIAVWQSHSLKMGSSFVGALLILTVVFSFLNRGILRLLEFFSDKLSWQAQYALKGLTRRPQSTGLVFTTMSLATLVLCLLPHLKSSILFEVRPGQQSQIPELFLFDIQPDQVEPLQQLVNNNFQIKLDMYPMVRARILKINDQPYERTAASGQFATREDEAEARFRNRGVNLTYRDKLTPSESLVEGQLDQVKSLENNQLPGISLEKKYSERIGAKIGDVMTFDVQGVEQKAKVSSLRQVRWTSFQPNFFILFPSGILEESPQIFLTSIPKSANQSRDSFGWSEKIHHFQSEVSQQFKNISVIHVAQVVENSLVYIDQMSFALQAMAWLAVVVGLFIFVILLNTQVSERLVEMNLIQILGSSSLEIMKIVAVQFGTLILLSLLSGLILSFVVARILIWSFFDIQTVYDFKAILILISAMVPLLALLIYIGLKPLERLNPVDLIRQG